MANHTTNTILRIDASMRREGSVSRELADRYIATRPGAKVITRDLARTPLPQIDAAWIGANFTDRADRTAAQRDTLALSDTLIGELRAADTIVIGLPVYNFGVPAALKAWIDLVARARETFRYTESGPEGLLRGKRAVILMASSGVTSDSVVDFATPYLRHVLGFLGIADVEVIAADALMADAGKLEAVRTQISGQRLAA
jgi:FMN-dependent NADH-azoreductase